MADEWITCTGCGDEGDADEVRPWPQGRVDEYYCEDCWAEALDTGAEEDDDGGTIT